MLGEVRAGYIMLRHFILD